MGSSVGFFLVLVFGLNLISGTAHARDKGGVVIENAEMHFIIGHDSKALRLVHKTSGKECLCSGVSAPAFSITQYQPYYDKLQHKYQANPKLFAADSVYYHGSHLVVSFELLNLVAIIGLKIMDSYIGFILEKLDHRIPSFGDNRKTSVDELVLLQLPVKDWINFDEWLKVVWNNNVAFNLLETDKYARIDAVKCDGYHLLRAHARLRS